MNLNGVLTLRSGVFVSRRKACLIDRLGYLITVKFEELSRCRIYFTARCP